MYQPGRRARSQKPPSPPPPSPYQVPLEEAVNGPRCWVSCSLLSFDPSLYFRCPVRFNLHDFWHRDPALVVRMPACWCLPPPGRASRRGGSGYQDMADGMSAQPRHHSQASVAMVESILHLASTQRFAEPWRFARLRWNSLGHHA
jgi:hypothetical protein